jgi:hypothetical protein
MRRLTTIILIAAVTAIIWPFVQIGLIAAQAQYFASGRPYCIQVPGSRNDFYYRQTNSLLELNGFNLHARYINGGGSGSHGSMQWRFHAVLVVADGKTIEWRNWSYGLQHFARLTPEQAKATHLYKPECQPQIDFIRTLPLSAAH